MLKAIWPSTANIPNALPESAHITTTGLMCYFLFWIIQFPFLLISPQRVRWLFFAKAIIVPPAFLAMMIWAFATTGGGEIFRQNSTLSGSSLGWAWMAALNSTLGNFCGSKTVVVEESTIADLLAATLVCGYDHVLNLDINKFMGL